MARAVHDAVAGKSHQRAKAREWLAKHVLPIKTLGEISTEPRREYDLLVRIYRIFEKGATNPEEVESALAMTFGALLPEERATLRAVLQLADSDEIKQLWDETRQRLRTP